MEAGVVIAVVLVALWVYGTFFKGGGAKRP